MFAEAWLCPSGVLDPVRAPYDQLGPGTVDIVHYRLDTLNTTYVDSILLLHHSSISVCLVHSSRDKIRLMCPYCDRDASSNLGLPCLHRA